MRLEVRLVMDEVEVEVEVKCGGETWSPRHVGARKDGLPACALCEVKWPFNLDPACAQRQSVGSCRHSQAHSDDLHIDAIDARATC